MSATTVAFSFYAFGMKKPSLIWCSLFVKLWMSTSGQWSIRYVSDLVKYSAYHVGMHYTKSSPVSFVLLRRSSSFSSTTFIETTLQKNHFSIISLKVVSQRSVFVAFDLIDVTKILEHIWHSDRRRRSEVRQDSETQQRNSVKVIRAKCRLTSLKSRVQKKWRSDSTTDISNYIDWIIWKIRWGDPGEDLPSIQHELSVFSWLCVFPYFHF